MVFVGDLKKNADDVIEFVKNNNYDCELGNHDEMMILYHSRLENESKTLCIRVSINENIYPREFERLRK